MNPRAYGDEFVLAVRHYLQTNNLKSLGQINAEILADLSQKFHDHHEAQQKQRKKKGDFTDEELAIYNCYPRKEGKLDALKAIREACQTTAPSVILEASRRYGLCVGRWPASYRYKDNRDLCPMPGTWFRGGRYLDDQKHWLPAGMFTRPDDTIERNPANAGQHESLPEPQGWRDTFKDYIHRDRPWSQLDRTTQQHISQEMQKLNSP